MVSSDMEAKTHQVMNDAYKGKDGKDHSFEDLPDSVLDEYMNTIAPNGYWSYLGNAIGLGGKNRLMAEWDRDVGSKIEDPTERKKARVAYAREFTQIGFENTERRKDRARAEIEGREKAFGAGAVAGATQIAGYALPMAAPGGVGIALSAGIEGATRRNELLQDRHETTDSGEIIRTAKGDTRNAALGKGAVGGAATALIEKYGGKIAGKALGKVAGKIPGADKIAGTTVGKFLSRTGKFIDRYFGWTGQQSAPEEYAEEFVQGLVDAAFGLDMRESEKEGTTALGRMADFTGEFFAPKNLADLGESMFLVQLLGGTVGHLKNRSDSKRADRVLQNLGYDISAAKDFTADEKWRAIDAHYRGMSSDQVNEIFDKGAKAMDGLIKQFESENLATADGRAHIAAMHPEAVKKIVETRKEGKDVSRKMIRDAGLSEDVWKDVAARNDLGDSFIADRKRTEEIKRAKMDGYQANALAETISEFFGDSPEAQKVFDRIVSNLKDASVLDDPAVRENLVMEEGEKFWAEGREERIKAARERAKAAEKADHEARLAEAERAKKESSVRAERDAQERTNAEMLAREERRFRKGQKAEQAAYDEMMLKREEARAKVKPQEPTAKPKEVPAQTEASRRELKDGYEMRPVEGSTGNVAYRVYDKNGKWVGNVRKDGSRAVAVNKLRTKGVEEGEYAPWEKGASAETEKTNTEAKNETRTDETQPNSEQAAQPGARKGKAARSVETAPAPAEVGGAVEVSDAKTDYPVGTVVERADGSKYIREEGTSIDPMTGAFEPKWRELEGTGAAKSGEGRIASQSHVFYGGGRVVEAAQKPPTSAPTEAKANTSPTSAEAVESGSRAAGAKAKESDTPAVRQTHDEAVEDVVAKAKSDGRKLDELGELRPPTPKIGSKPGRVTPLKKMDEKSVVNALKNVASSDEVRGYLHRVHVENGDMVATDGRVLLFGKAPKGMKDGEYATTPIGQKRIDDRYPLWKQVVPDAKRSGYKVVGVISNGDISTDSVAFAGRLNKRFHKEQRKDSPRADIRIGEQLVSPELLKNLTDAMFRLGSKDITVYQGKTINSPLLLKGRNADGEITGVIMPLRIGEDVDSAKKTHVRLFGKSTEESADKKTARTVKNDTKSAESAPQTPETAAKKPFEEKYREWAEEDVPAWAKDLSPEEKAEYERLLDDVLSPKEGKSDIERGEKAADAYNALMEFEKAHTPKRGRGRPKKDVGAKDDTPEALADNYAKFVQQRIDRFKSAKTSADFDKVKDFAEGELEARKAVSSNPEAVKKFNEKYGKLFAEQNRVVHEATEKWRQVKEVEDAKAEEDAKAFRASPEGFAQLEKDVNRIFGKFRVNAGSVSKTEEVVSVSDLIKRGYKVEKAKRGAAYNYQLTPPDGNGWYKIGKKELRLDGEEYNKAIADLIEYSERVAKGEKVAESVAPKVEEEAPKSAKPDVDEVKKAMRALGALGGADISALEKALKEAEGGGLKERAKLSKTLLDYKKNLPKYDDARSDVTSGGRYRASIETAKPLDDPDFKAWAKKRGVVPTQQKREQYDKERINAATKALSRWIKGVKVRFVNAISEKTESRYDKKASASNAAESDLIMPPKEVSKEEALQKIDSILGIPLVNDATGIIAVINKAQRNKIISNAASRKSQKNGFSFGVHNAASSIIDKLWKHAELFENRGDFAGDVNIKSIKRFVAPFKFGEHTAFAYITAKESIRDGHRIYSLELQDVKTMEGMLEMLKEQSPASTNLTKESLQLLVNKVNPSFATANADVRLLHDGERIVGSYNRKTGEVTLAKGADIGTVVHELGWHAARHWAETAAAKGNRRAIALLATMRRYAEEAPPEIKKAVLATYGDIDADALLDEIGAARFTAEKSPAIAKAIDSRAGAAWYKKIWNAVVDFIKDYLVSQDSNRVDLTGVENMSPQRFANFFATAMLSGKTLGENRNTMALEKSLLDAWTSKLSDYLDPVRKLSRRFYGTDGEAYRMGRIRKGTAQQGRNKAERAMKRVDKILVKNEISPGLLDQYMQAMAYEERNAKIEKRNRKKDGSGMTQETADKIFKEIDERGIRDKIQEAAQMLWDLQDEGLQERVKAGLISQETADRWRKEEPHHVPWRDAIDPESNEWMGRDYTGPEFQTAEGRSTSATGSPTTLMLQEFVNAFERAAENRFRQEIADMARMNDVIGTIYDAVQTDKRGNRSFIKYPQGGERAKVMSIPDGAKLESTSKGDGGLDNVLVFRENGETKYLVLNGDLGKAVAGAATGRTVAKANKAVSALMRGYSATATALSPTFAARNLGADNLDVSGNLIKDYGYLVGGRLIKKTLVNEAKMAKDLLKYSYSGTFDGTSKEFQDLVDRFESAGGLIGGATTEGYDEMQKRIAADFRAGRNRARTLGRNIAAGWLTLQKASELTTRLAVFKALAEHGLSDKEAAMWSRESTVDFNKKGNWTPITNVLWMFSNSALGSSTRQLKGLFTTKNGIKFASGIAALGIAEGVLECAMNPEDDDDEGLGSGADMTEHERQNHFYIRFGNHVFKTKFHMGPFGYLKYLGNVAGRVMCGKMTAEKAAEELGSTALEVGAAFTGIGNVSMDAVAETSVPTILQPIVQGMTGVDYAGRPIYKKKFNEAKPDSSHGRSSTPGVYHWLAKVVNSLTGGGDYEKGGIDLTPETLKHITEAVGKNFVRDVVNIAGLGWNAITGNIDLSETRNIPFARDVHRKIDGNENRYYEALRRFEEDKYMLKDPNLKGEDRKKFFREHPWLRTNGAIGGTVVGSLKKKIDEWRRLEEKEGVSEEAKAKYKAFRRKAQARVIELMTPLEK